MEGGLRECRATVEDGAGGRVEVAGRLPGWACEQLSRAGCLSTVTLEGARGALVLVLAGTCGEANRIAQMLLAGLNVIHATSAVFGAPPDRVVSILLGGQAQGGCGKAPES